MMQTKTNSVSKRMLSLLLAMITVFSLFAVVPFVSAEAACNKQYDANGRQVLVNAQNQPTSNADFNRMLEEAFQSVDDYQYKNAGTGNPYKPSADYKYFNCAAFVTYVYTYWIGVHNNYLDGVRDESGGYVNQGVIPILPPNPSNQGLQNGFSESDKGVYLQNASLVASWYDYCNAAPGWGNVVKVSDTGKTLEQLSNEMAVGTILFFSRSGRLEDIPSSDGGESHMGIYAGGGMMYHCGSANGVEKIQLQAEIDKLGSSDRWVGFSIPTEEKGDIIIKKTDENGNALAGAEFELRDASGNLVNVTVGSPNPATTGADGMIQWRNLEIPGTYTINETKIPDGHVAEDGKTSWTVNLTKENSSSSVELNIKNPTKNIRYNICLQKVGDDEKTPLAGAKFGLYDNATGKLVTDPEGLMSANPMVTKADGYILFENVPAGEYDLTELEPPPGYAITPGLETISGAIHLQGSNPNAYDFRLNPEKMIKIPNIKLDDKGTIAISKVSTTGKKLQGAVFELRELDGTKVTGTTSVTTDANGTAYFTDIPYGSYKLVETVCPPNCTPKDGKTSWDVTVSADESIVSLVIENVEEIEEVGSLHVLKKDDSGNVLAGVVFELTLPSGTTQPVTTDSNGELYITNMPYGNYKLTEKAPPAGYEFKDGINSWDITVSDATPAVEIEIINPKVPRQLIIKKVDTEGHELDGAAFTLIGEDGEAVDIEGNPAITSNGVATINNIPNGKYTLVETAFPEGYKAKDGVTSWDIEISDTTPVVEITIENERDTADIPVTKVWVDDDSADRPAEITLVLLDDGKEVKTVTIGKDEEGTTVDGNKWSYTFTGLDANKVAAGKYTIKEVEVKGYETTIKSDGKGGFVITNTLPDIPTMDITKVDGISGKALPGAEITVYNAKGEEIFKGTTGEDGKITFERPEAGQYTYQETKAPAGYELNETIYTFIVTNEGEIEGDTSLPNSPVKNYISKLDIITGKPVANAQIAIYNSDRQLVVYGNTDENGRYYFDRLEPGEYAFYETAAPAGYEKNTTRFTFTVHDDYTITGDDTVMDEPHVIIEKTDVSTGKPLQGATIEVYDSDNKLIKVGITDERGQMYFAAPKAGQYIYKETKAPEGYILDEGTHVIEIHSDGTITGTKFTNTPIVPKTGIDDYLPYIIGAGGLLIAALAIVVVIDKKRKNDRPDGRA